MSLSTDKRHKKKIVPSKLVKAAVLVSLCVYFICVLINQQCDLSKYKSISSEYNQKIQDATLKTKQLKDEHAQSSTDEYMERMAREKLGLIKANERVFVDVSNCD